jgi:hypothetical protein
MWAGPPQDAGRADLTNHRDVTGSVATEGNGTLVGTLTHSPRYSRAGWPYHRPVAFDAAGRRHLFSFASGQMNDRVATNRYRLPPVGHPVRHAGVTNFPPRVRKWRRTTPPGWPGQTAWSL